ncbi:glycosyltransferase family 2 protein [Geodermatophilus sp. YIM 151500]|uniref:glycosyltransferase family 2 protein n=1 Tax=Geodermatophilus sp. YIM 151500 TaxID=2984531 RepID=UPI0021E45868|nr:glycosyltransferase family 2 protein [Geodermatophilus sp. YIM 151500]MCV2488576.1 glycosyltransferase family 2 protein [Geodermatophilus sp. YIM 151500]
MTDRPGVAPLRVVAVTYSPGEALEGFVDSLAAATSLPVEVVLADNGSTDGVPEKVAARHEHVRLLPTGGNIGYGAAVNAGLSGRSSGWALVANPDVRFEPGSVDELLAVARRWPRAATVGPAIRTPDDELYPSARDLPRLSTGVGHAVFGWVWPANPWTARYRREREAPRERTAGWLSGSCFLVDLEAFWSVGGFDPGYFMYFEDVDLAERLGRRGYLHVYAPSAVVVHEGGHATRREPHRMARVHHTSALRYMAARHPGRRNAPLRAALRAGLGARMLLSYVSGRVAAGAPFQRGAGELQRGAARPDRARSSATASAPSASRAASSAGERSCGTR